MSRAVAQGNSAGRAAVFPPAQVRCPDAHIDIFPTLAELTAATWSDEMKQQVEGHSLLPLLKNPKAEWPDRILVHHVGRWAKGGAEKSKFSECAIQNSRFTLVNNRELYDLKADPGEKTNVIADHPDVVAKLRTAYEKWWSDVQPLLVNENVVAPKMNPFKELYWKQFGGGPDARLLEKMNPNKKSAEKSGRQPAKKQRKNKIEQ